MYYLSKDLETTGTNHLIDEPVQVAWTIFDDHGKVRRSIVHLVNTDVPIQPGAQAVHHISKDRLLDEGLACADVAERYINMVWDFQPLGIIGYNIISFDFPIWQNFMCRHHKGSFPHPPVLWIADVMHMVSRKLGTRKWLKLKEAAKRLNVPVNEELLHDAKYDNELTFDVYMAVNKK
jgi:DNA polymerase III epsilon subunit-like protein